MAAPGRIVRAFLREPNSRRLFDAFFALCHTTAAGFLKYFHSRGYQLPLHRADTRAAYSDLALTLLGEFFHSKPGRPFVTVFDYYERHGLLVSDVVTDEDLYRHFKILLCGYLKKQLFRLRRTENPQVEILKRRIKEILQPPEYIRLERSPGDPAMVAKASYADDLRPRALPVTPPLLHAMVEQAYVYSLNRSAWCASFYDLLNEEEEYQNFVVLTDLLQTMVAANAAALHEFLPKPSRPATAETELVRRYLDRLIEETVNWAGEKVLPAFVRKGRISADEAGMYLRAVERYLLDLGNCGDTDSLPRYFREVMPRNEHAHYLSRHKYPFETVISRSSDFFRSRLEKGLQEGSSGTISI